LSNPEEEKKLTPILSMEQIEQMRSEVVNNFANTQTSTLLLINTLTEQHSILANEVKKRMDDNATLNTQIKVAEIEITKLKEKSSKSNKGKDLTPPPNTGGSVPTPENQNK